MVRIPTAQTVETPTGPTVQNSSATFPHLTKLVGAAALTSFLEESLGQRPFRRRMPEAHLLFGWEALNSAVSHHRLGPPRLKLEKGGADAGKGVFRDRRPSRSTPLYDVDLPLLYERLRDGATLILDAVNEFGGPLKELCAGLANEFAAASQANLYACWGTSQGFDIHWDDHDVFVIQLAGAKRWMLYGSTRSAPLRRDVSEDHPRPNEPLEEFVLEAGDMLYLPRGYWHAAVGTGGPTLHLTVGLTRKTGHDLLVWLADQALSQPLVRSDMPLERDDATLGRHVANVLAAAMRATDPADLGRRFRRHAEARRVHRPELSFPFIGQATPDHAANTRLRLAEGAVHLRAAGPSAFILSHRGVEYTLADSLRGAVAAMAEGKTVTLGELSAALPAAAEDVSAFITDMMSRGVFVLAAS